MVDALYPDEWYNDQNFTDDELGYILYENKLLGVARLRQVHTRLTLSPPIPLKLYTLPYWSNPPFLTFDIRALWRSGLSARVPECQKLKNSGLDQYGAEPFEQQ